jgi:hypothetical protein
MGHEIDTQQAAFPEVRAVAFGTPLAWLRRGWQDFRAQPLHSASTASVSRSWAG